MPYSARWLALFTGLLALGVGSAYAQCFVSTMGNDANDCLTQGDSCLTIQHAVDLVAAGSCPADTVNVAAGTYIEQVTIRQYCREKLGPVLHDCLRISCVASGRWAGRARPRPLPFIRAGAYRVGDWTLRIDKINSLTEWMRPPALGPKQVS